MEGFMVSAFAIEGVRDVDHNLRARLMGQRDEWAGEVVASAAEECNPRIDPNARSTEKST